ncbi:SPOR domain-containing protein [Neisseria montereyensis]|uniref:SPOR domain-containing protein n=1 Tax=Neisseria montereyensis TaxID=2973938 RepID=A0ABT2FD06_9NEIS|nr:SPOR domain-containing protein [Neisseria montereyensis]MCS4534114.1 SPOR domain-containing protein [Neisseria montereyensis]
MNTKKQSGKGLSGFLLGLLLATIVIAGVVFFINRSNEKVFKEDVVEEAPEPEILTPDRSVSAVSEPSTASEPALEASQASDVMGDFIKEQQASEEETGEVIVEEEDNVVTPPPVETEKATPPAPRVEPKRESKPVEKKAEAKPKPKKEREQPKKATPKATPKKETQPSAEQILNSGSIEKAREDVRKEEDRKAKASQAEKQSARSSRMVVLQMGSFNDRASAETHRAKLAMMGVPGRITEADVNGKHVYRVQSNRLDSNSAKQTQQVLKKNGVDSFARTVK